MISIISRLALLIAVLMMPGMVMARQVTDMLGRQVQVPDRIERVFTTAPPATLTVYALAPETLVSFYPGPVMDPAAKELTVRLLDARVAALPNLGSLLGHGAQSNLEQVLATRPDVVVAWSNNFLTADRVLKPFAAAGIPVIFLDLQTLADYPAAFTVLGEVFGRQDLAARQAAYIQSALNRVNQAVGQPGLSRPGVYYAESPDGLATDCDKSLHAEAIALAGGGNVYRCEQQTLEGMDKVTLEQVIAFAPRIIVSQSPAFAAMAQNDSRWRVIEAVEKGRIVTVPAIPFNWIDRPPSYMRALGIQWLAGLFHPDRFQVDLRRETRDFYRLFLHVDLTEADLDAIIPKSPAVTLP